MTVQLIPSVWRQIDWGIIGAMGSVAALFMPLGSYVLTTADTAVMSRAMAAIVPRAQPMDATHALNRSAGVSKPNVFRGLSFN